MGKSSLILSYVENLVSIFEEMYERNLGDESVPHSTWLSAMSNAYQVLENFQNLSAIFKFTHDYSDKKIE